MTLAELTEELVKLFDAALEVEPAGGVNDAWAKVLAAHGVQPVGAAERAAQQQRLKLARGALPAEVAAVARVICARHGQVPDAVWSNIEPRYVAIATARPKSMFAFAVATAHEKSRASWQRPPGGYVIRCSQCGGPRLTAELACAFCGREGLGT